MDNIELYVVHGLYFNDRKVASADVFLYGTFSNKWVAYKYACRLLLKELTQMFGEPKPIRCQDELEDDAIYNNQQVVKAYDIYKDNSTVSYTENGVDHVRNKLEWDVKYARINSIFEQMREETKENDMTGLYIYVDKTKHTN